jgi:cytochrome c-type biogenesis protein CcmH
MGNGGNMKRLRWATGFWLMAMSQLASAQESPPQAVVPPAVELGPEENKAFRDAAKDLRCPTCQGMSILESDAAFSVQMKNAVKEKVKEGMNKDQILQFFTERYGPWILREPPKSGFNSIAWILPLALMFGGPLAVWFFVWRKRQVVPTHGVRPTNEILAEMERSLSSLRQEVRS